MKSIRSTSFRIPSRVITESEVIFTSKPHCQLLCLTSTHSPPQEQEREALVSAVHSNPTSWNCDAPPQELGIANPACSAR